MNGKVIMIPKCYENTPLPDNYRATFAEPNQVPQSEHNLLELSRYAKSVGKPIRELTKEEIDQFKV